MLRCTDVVGNKCLIDWLISRRCSSRCRPAARSCAWPRACSAPFTRRAFRRSSSASLSHRRVSASRRRVLERGSTSTKSRTATYCEPASGNTWFYKVCWTSLRASCLSHSLSSYGSRATKASIRGFASTHTVPVCRPTRSLTPPTHPTWPAAIVRVVRWPCVSSPKEGRKHRLPDWSTHSNYRNSMISMMFSKTTKGCFLMFDGGGIGVFFWRNSAAFSTSFLGSPTLAVPVPGSSEDPRTSHFLYTCPK